MELFWQFMAGENGIFLINTLLAVSIGFLIGVERESRHKDAGISTHILVICGAMVFSYVSLLVDSESRIAAQIVSGIGFLGAGLILKSSNEEHVHNLTTASSIWFCAAVGMAIGFGLYGVAIVSSLVGLLVPRIPRVTK